MIGYSILCIVWLILWGASEFLGIDTATAAIGTFACFIMAKLEDIHRDIRKEGENEHDGE